MKPNKAQDKIISQIYSQLAQLVNQGYAKVADDVIVDTEFGTVVFNRYVIRPINNGVELINRSGTKDMTFSSSKHALVWAILDRHNKILEANRLIELDCLLSSSQIDAQIHERLKRKGGIDQHLINHSKLQYDLARQKQFREEIDKYIILAQKCQKLRTKP
jgi:hypothetical protein